MRYRATTFLCLLFLNAVYGQFQPRRFGNRGRINTRVNKSTRDGLLAETLGLPAVPGGFSFNANQVSAGTPSGCFCLPLNQVCDPQGPVPALATRINTINTRIINTNPTKACPSEQRPCCFGSGGGIPTTQPPPFPIPGRNSECGTRRSIFPGAARTSEADFGDYPWMAAILGAGDRFIAGGALIESDWVLTAAHKVTQKNGLVVRVGDYDLSNPSEAISFPHQEVRVSRVIVHPAYNSQNLFNDVALLKLQTPVRFTEHVRPVCLPEKFQRFSGQRCYVSGWGMSAEGRFQPILREVDVPIIDELECEVKLRRTRLGPTFDLDTDSFMCAGGEAGKDACRGDGGSPLVCDEGGFFTVVGLVAWGIDCGQPDVPGVYVNVATYSDFIQRHVRNRF